MLLQATGPNDTLYEKENPALVELRGDEGRPLLKDFHRSSIIQGQLQAIPPEIAA